jgi:putative transposase
MTFTLIGGEAMPGPKPPVVLLTEGERQALEQLTRAHKTAQHLVLRARIILLLADGRNAPETARALGITRKTVRLWRRYWFARATRPINERLQDEERPGAPATFTAEQWCHIIALACEPPAVSGRPISQWTARELADEAVKRGIVPRISTRHVGRFLKSGGVATPPQPVLA